jgi:hypothetical protein
MSRSWIVTASENAAIAVRDQRAEDLARGIHQLAAAIRLDDGKRAGAVAGSVEVDRILQLREFFVDDLDEPIELAGDRGRRGAEASAPRRAPR